MKAAPVVQDAFATEIRTRAEIASVAESEIRMLVELGRAKGVTWPTIASALRISERAAQGRFALTDGEKRNRLKKTSD